MPLLHVVGAAIVDQQRCLVARRGPGRLLAGQWEFPGGKVEPSESPQAALAREIEEELALAIEVGALLARGHGHAAGGDLVLDVYSARITSGELDVREHAEVRWASADELGELRWADADVPAVAPVQRLLRAAQLSASARSPR